MKFACERRSGVRGMYVCMYINIFIFIYLFSGAEQYS